MENETKSATTVGKTALRYGIISAFASILFTLIIIVAGANPYENNWWRGLLSLAIAVTIIVLAHKYFKENGDGFMTYGQGFGIAFLMSVVSIVIGFIFNYLYTKMDPTVLDAIWDKTAHDMEEKGQGQEQIDMAVNFTKRFFWIIFFVAATFFSVIIALIVPIFTQKKKPESAF